MAASTGDGTSVPGPYVPGYSFDVFLSYAHVDNMSERPDVDQQGWVDRFVMRLEAVLWHRVGERVKVWRDVDNLKKSDTISPAIRSSIEGSAVFLVLVSNRYLKSQSCKDEVQWIERQCQGRGAAATGSLVFPILLYRIPEVDRPTICRDKVGFEFFAASGPDKAGRPLDPLLEVGLFTERLEQLVNELSERLKQLRPAPRTQPTAAAAAGSYRVLLTATPGKRLRQRERIRQTLIDDGTGIDVVADVVPPPYEIQAHARAFGSLLDGVDLSVHLVDEDPGPVLEGAPDLCFPEVQCRLAHERGVQQLVVLPEFVDLETLEIPSHQTFLGELSRGVWPAPGGAGKLRMQQARLEEAILGLIREEHERTLRARAAAAAPAVAGGRVFIEVNTKDLPAVVPLFEFLERRQLEPITIPSTESSPANCRQSFVESVTASMALIIVYGDVRLLDWVKSRILNAIRLIIERELPLKPIVAALPPAKQLDKLAFLQCPIVDCTANFNEDGLAALLGGRPR